MRLARYFRISAPAEGKVPDSLIQPTYRTLRNRTFWGATIAYSLYYICRMSLAVVKQPIIDEGILTPTQLGVIGACFLYTYAAGKFINGFVADYCNVRRFMAAGIAVSALMNFIMGVCGLLFGLSHGFPPALLMAIFAVLWGINGWVLSMGSPPGIISLSRWFPKSRRGTYYSIFSASPYFGKSLSLFFIGIVVGFAGWQYGFLFSALMGLAGMAVILLFVSDTPESKGLPRIQELSGESLTKEDEMPVKELQKTVLSHPGIWIIALSSAFVYISQHALEGWGVFFLQKAKDFSLGDATQIFAISTIFGIAGTVLAGWLSDRVFRGSRIIPVIISGVVSTAAFTLFLLTGGSYFLNILYVAAFSLSIGVLYCIVAGLMAIDIVPRRATGAALGIVGISSYAAAGIQDIASGYLIENFAVPLEATTAAPDALSYNFLPASTFWIAATFIAFVLPALCWKKLKIRHCETSKRS